MPDETGILPAAAPVTAATPPDADRDSYAPLVYRITMYTKSANGEWEPHILPSYAFVQSLRIEQDRSGFWTGTLALFDRGEGEGTLLEELVIVPGVRERVYFTLEWNWDNRGDALADVPIWASGVTNVVPKPTPTGVGLELELIPASIVRSTIKHLPEDMRWPAGKTASEIVTDIVDKMNWNEKTDTDDDTTAQTPAVIETSDGTLGEKSITEGQDAVRFIIENIIPEAKNSNKEAFVFFTDHNGAVHFHSMNHAYGGHTPTENQAEYSFARDNMGEVLSFEPDDNGWLQGYMGGAYTVAEGIDSKGGRPTAHTAKPGKGVTTKALDGTESTDEPGRAATSEMYAHDLTEPDTVAATVAGSTQVADPEMAYVPLACRDSEQSRRLMGRFYAMMLDAKVSASLEVKGTHRVKLADHIRVVWYTRAGNIHYMSGRYAVVKVEHDLSGRWTTTFDLRRKGFLQLSSPQIEQALTTWVTETISTLSNVVSTVWEWLFPVEPPMS